MLSRIGRFATVAVIAAGGFAFTQPQPAAAATLACGDPGVHLCCGPDASCPTGQFCCAYNGTQLYGCGCGG